MFDRIYKVTTLVLLFVVTLAVVAASVELIEYVNASDSAWTAPWINVINRGPVQ